LFTVHIFGVVTNVDFLTLGFLPTKSMAARAFGFRHTVPQTSEEASVVVCHTVLPLYAAASMALAAKRRLLVAHGGSHRRREDHQLLIDARGACRMAQLVPLPRSTPIDSMIAALRRLVFTAKEVTVWLRSGRGSANACIIEAISKCSPHERSDMRCSLGVDPGCRFAHPGYGSENFESIRKYFFIRGATFLGFDAAMSPGGPHGADTIDWYVEPDRFDAPLPPVLTPRRRRDDERAQSLALAITTALLFVLIAVAVMFGGRAAIGPMLRQNTAREPGSPADVLYAMPDGVFCRRMAFDNVTAEITSAAVERCPAAVAGADAPNAGRFDWGHR
jgi:hypothetical protein